MTISEGPATPQPARALAGAWSGAASTVDGDVLRSQSRWSGGRIVTESLVRAGDGREVLVTQMGGTVDGIGMVQFPGQTLLAPGARVSLLVPAAPEVNDVNVAHVAQPVPVLEVLAYAPKGDGEVLKGGPEEWAPDPGYVRTLNEYDAPLYWASGCVYIIYDVDGTGQIAGAGEFAVMDSVFARWRQDTQSCSYLEFQIGEPASVEVGFDGVNAVKFRDDKWCKPASGSDPERCYSPSAAAITTLHFVNDPENDRNGEILDADIELNGEFFAISTGGESLGRAPCLSDLANTLTHEVGHLMGFDHTCRAATEPQRYDDQGELVPSCSLGPELPVEIRDSTMYNYQECGETIKATPEADDVAAVCAVYPLEQNPNECKEAVLTRRRSLFCAIAPPGASPGGLPALWLAGFLGAALFLRRRRR